MKCDKRDLLLYAVTDRSWSEGTTLGAQVEEALRGGATFVQLREKKLTGEAPVSYTHLDVYKRQVMADEPQEMGEITAHAGALALNMGTPGERREQDVYKRQM